MLSDDEVPSNIICNVGRPLSIDIVDDNLSVLDYVIRYQLPPPVARVENNAGNNKIVKIPNTKNA